MPKTLCFFGTLSKESLALAELLEPVANHAGFDFYALFPKDTNPTVYFNACLAAEAVVVDATIEQDVENVHYGNFNAMHIAFDHIIVVSRTYLPVNFTTLFRDIAPNYPYPQPHPKCVKSGAEQPAWGNHDIIEQLAKRLPELDRPALAASLPGMDADNLESFYQAYTDLMRESVKRISEASRKGKRKVFISYRSLHIAEVKQFIKQYEDLYDFTVLSPGLLAYDHEILTRLRRWQVMSILDRYIERVDEVWVYDTPDYTNSWWTQGELITLAYRQFAGSYCPEIKTCRPGENQGLTPGYAKLPTLTEKQEKQIARLYSNSDPLTMGPESTRNIRIMRTISDIPLVGSAFHWTLGKLAKSKAVINLMTTHVPVSLFSQGEISAEDILSQYADKEFMKQYLHDPVWRNSFSENPVLEYGKEGNSDGAIRVDDFIGLTGLKYEEFTPDQLEQYVKSQRYSHDNVSYAVEQAAPRYLWFANRMGRQEKNNLNILYTILFSRKDSMSISE